MAWKLVPTHDVKLVIDLYNKIFPDPLTLSEFELRNSKYKTHLYFIQRSGEPPAGFTIYRGRDGEVEMWQAGVLPEKRRQKAGTCIIDQGSIKMSEKGYSRITVRIFNHWNIMLSMLIKRGYKVIRTAFSDKGDDIEIELYQELKRRKEIRYALTEICNFNCLFCHNEGLGREKRKRLPDEQVLTVLNEAVHLGYSDITFTGGEPLLQKDRLFFLVDQFGRMDAPPDLTLVTNGSLLDENVVNALVDYPGKRKIHLSLHATDEPSFKRITRVSKNGMFNRVVNNVRMAAKNGLTVKVNHVLLRDLNHKKATDAVDLAYSLGATAIKFLELLVLPKNASDYRMFYQIEALERQIAQIAEGPVQNGPRQKIFHYSKDARFIIELQHLTCAMGCSHCREIRDRTFSSDMNYHPCFIRHRSNYPVKTPEQLEDIFTIGDRIIDGYAARFRDASPTLIQKERYVPGKREFFFLVDSGEKFREFIKSNKFKQKSAVGFHEEYFRPVKHLEGWASFKKVLKISWDYHNRNKINLICTDNEYINHKKLGLETVTRFLQSSGPIQFDDAESAKHFLKSLDFLNFLELEWEIETWTAKGIDLNLSFTGDLSTVKVYGPAENAVPFLDLFKAYNGLIEPLCEPLIQFMQREEAGEN